VAEISYALCSNVKGEAGPAMATPTGTKTKIMAYLKGAFDYCDGVYSGFTDAHLNEPADFWRKSQIMTPCITAISSRICAKMDSSRPGDGFDGAAARRGRHAGSAKKEALSEVMRVKIWGAAKALVIAVTSCVSMIPAAAQKGAHSTAQTVAATKDGRAEIDAHVAEWLKESDVPSIAVAYIQDRKVAWTEVYGEQSPGVAATEKRCTTLRL
jgi:hypothetical protein